MATVDVPAGRAAAVDPPWTPLTYSPSLDGLRALAVLAVIAYHAELGARAGYLGVSLFFTISGFLITRQILDRHRAGTWGWGTFAAQRVRRLAPMALVTLAGVTLVDTVHPFFWGRDDVGGDTIAAALHVVNWWFIGGARGYDGPTDIPSPVQHFWSLSVEEQFYLALPILLAVALWVAVRRGADLVTVVLGVAAAAALVSLAIGLATGGERAYFGTDSRALELLLGVIAGALAHRGALAAPQIRRWLSRAAPVLLIGLVAVWILGPATTHWLFDGWLPVIAAAAALLIAGVTASTDTLGWLSHPVVVGVGRRSYSLYLVHWPIILATGPRVIDAPATVRWAVRIVAIIALAEAGFRWVETPIRRRHSFVGRRLAAAYLGAVTVLIIVTLPTIPTAPTAEPFAAGLPSDVAARFERDGELARLGRRPAMLDDPDPDLPALVLRGDSTARFLGGPLSHAVPKLGYRLINLGAPGCVLGGDAPTVGPVDGDGEAGAIGDDPGEASGCPTIADDNVVATTLKPRAVVFTFGVADMAFLAATDPTLFTDRVEAAVATYVDVGALVVLVAPWPEPEWQQAIAPGVPEAVTADLRRIAEDTDGVVLTEGGGLFAGERRDDRALRPDGVHIYDQALGRKVVSTTLGPALAAALAEAAAERRG